MWFVLPPWLASWLKRLLSLGYRRWQRPRLKIYLDPRETCHNRAVDRARGRFCHFVVRNDGKRPARNCRALLVGVSLSTPPGETPAPDFVAPGILKWADAPDWEPCDIEPSEPRCAHLCYAVEEDPHLYFSTRPGPFRVRSLFPRYNHLVRVRVDSDDAVRTDATFDIFFAGTWSTISVTPALPT